MAPFLGELRMFAGSYAPEGRALCDGQLLPIAEHEDLFRLIGVTYGGDGWRTFALPDLRGRVPVGVGGGPGLSSYWAGQRFGVEQVTLTPQQLPAHRHELVAARSGGDAADPTGKLVTSAPITSTWIRDEPTTPLAAEAVGQAGGGEPHENRMPALAISWIICLEGTVVEWS